MLGTHNSLSYLPVKQWWLKPFFWVGRCQSKNIEQQYADGVRYFDIRVRFPLASNNWRSAVPAHGLITYKDYIERILYKISMFDERCMVRIFFENSKTPCEWEDKLAEDFCHQVIRKYPEIDFVEGGSRYRYKQLIGPIPENKVVYYAEYWKRKFCIPFPWLWAKLHNKRNAKFEIYSDINVYDFYQYR